MERPPEWSAAVCLAHADELEERARKATATWAREQCLFSADLWRSLAKEAEARETAAHNLAAGKSRVPRLTLCSASPFAVNRSSVSRQRLANLPPPLVHQTNSDAFAVNLQPPAAYCEQHSPVRQVASDNASRFVRLTVRKLVKLFAECWRAQMVARRACIERCYVRSHAYFADPACVGSRPAGPPQIRNP